MDITAMRVNKQISIVIPVYNEAERLAACLEAIAALELAPLEVLVIDNNSTDDSAALARRYPWVRVLHEKQQGVVHARNRGFNAARGDIIARIDADTIVTPGWTAQLQTVFTDTTVAGVSGSITYHDVALGPIVDRIDFALRAWLAGKMSRRMFLHGANMAIRRSAWQSVKQFACSRTRMHEDLDLAIHFAEAGQKIIYDPLLVAGISGRRADTSRRDFYDYAMLNPQTYKYHAAKEYRYMYVIVLIVLMTQTILRILFRGYDAQNRQFSWKLLLAGAPAERVNPATFS
jgi:glycosyltransferase involved in cell wall biosynthesis